MLKCNINFDLRFHHGSMRRNVNCCRFESYFTSPIFLFVLLNLSCSFLQIWNSFLLIIVFLAVLSLHCTCFTRGFSCPVSCGTLVAPARIEPMPTALEGGFSTAGPPGKSSMVVIVLFVWNWVTEEVTKFWKLTNHLNSRDLILNHNNNLIICAEKYTLPRCLD